MKYADLRRRLKEAERHAQAVERNAETATSILLGMAREDERCGHKTVRRDDWPCPHPTCTRDGTGTDVLLVASIPPLMRAPPPDREPGLRITTLRRERYATPTGDVWMWRARP